VQQRWSHLLDEPPNSKELDELVTLLKQGFVILLNQVYLGKKFQENDPLFVEFDKGLVTLIANNLCLGAEFEQSGHPRRVNPVELEIISTFPLQQVINQVMEEGRRKRTISESEIQKLGESFAQVLFALCELGQAAGRERVSRPAKRAAAPAQEPARGSSGAGAEPRPVEQSAAAGPSSKTVTRHCQSCGKIALTKQVSFQQNIGMVILRRYRKVEGWLCAECIEKYFWEMTGKSLLFGWWGIISFFVTPFLLLGNLSDYLASGEVRKQATGLSDNPSGWKAVTILSLMTISCFIVFLFYRINNSSTTYVDTPSPRVSTPRASRVASNQSSSPTSTRQKAANTQPPRPTSTPSCSLWSEVTASDQGKTLCVYGVVSKAYWAGGDDIYYLSFSNDTNAFSFIVIRNYFIENAQGRCIMKTGEVKTYGQMPYIEIGKEFFYCD